VRVICKIKRLLVALLSLELFLTINVMNILRQLKTAEIMFALQQQQQAILC
jgi:hypothetical protein